MSSLNLSDTAPDVPARDWRLTLSNLIAIAALVVTLTVASCGGLTSTSAADLNQRITKVETQQQNDGQRLERMERSLERLDSKMDRLLEAQKK